MPIISATVVDFSLTRPVDPLPETIEIKRFDEFFQTFTYEHFLDYVWRLVETQPIFTSEIDIIDFNSLTAVQRESVNSGDPLYDALSGNDRVTLPNDLAIAGTSKTWDPNSTFFAGDGDDWVIGGALNDIINGGRGRDRIDGGFNQDSVGNRILPVLLGNFENDTAKYDFVFRSTETNIAVVTAASGSIIVPEISISRGTQADLLTNVEFAEFTNGKVPLFNWSFEVTRSDLGKAIVKFFENGVLLKQYNNCFFDSALPVSPGEYDADIRVRTNGTYRIELTDGSTGGSSVAGRTAIQLHTGTYEQHSEGCIVFPQFTNEVMKHIMDRIGTQSLLLKTLPDGRKFLDLPIDINVSFLDNIEQTKLTFGSDDFRMKEGTTSAFSLKVDETVGFDNKLAQVFDVTFKITGTATYGQDYVIRDESGNTVVVSGGRFTSRLNANDSTLDFTFVAIADGDTTLENCRLSIADIDIRHDATKAFDPYSVSTNLAAFSLQERLLLPTALDEKFIDFAILA